MSIVVRFIVLLLLSNSRQLAGDFIEDRARLEALGHLDAPPIVHDASAHAASSESAISRAIFFEALEYQGRPTRVFAWLGIPERASSEHPVPAIVLVHGGGGSAFREWVELWVSRGYAAISIAVEGQTDVVVKPGRPREWARHDWSGPARQGIYGDTKKPLADQWMYHAVADVVLANSLLHSMPEVDAGRIGLMGISWGGIITSTVMGIDSRFSFAIHAYGSGQLHLMTNQYGSALLNNEQFQQVWDPAIRIGEVAMPALWLSWPGDQHFSLDVQAATYRAAPGPRMVSLVPDMKHSHKHAWQRTESYAFADSVLVGGRPWCLQMSVSSHENEVTVDFDCTRPLHSASLISTTGAGHTGSREWMETRAMLNKSQGGNWQVTATLPPGTSGWFINVQAKDLDSGKENIIASSDYKEVLSLE